MKRKSSSTIQYLILMILLTGAAFYGLFFLFQQISNENMQVSVISSQINADAQKQTAAANMETVLASTATERASVDSTILSSDGFVPFIEAVEALGRAEKVSLTDSLSTAPDPNSTIGTEFLVVQVQLTGSWDAVLRTISLIELMPYALTISDLSLNKDLSVTKGSVWDASFTLNVEKYQ